MMAERLQEIEGISEVLKRTTDQIAIKRQRLERAKRANDFTLCDPIKFKHCGPFSGKRKL